MDYSHFPDNAAGWRTWPSPAVTTECGSYGDVLGGAGEFGRMAFASRTLTRLPPHEAVRVRFTFVKIDSWNNEEAQASVDGVPLWRRRFNLYSGSRSICGVSPSLTSRVWFDEMMELALLEEYPNATSVSLTISPASVRISARFTFASAASAVATAQSIRSASTQALSALLGAPVEAVESVAAFASASEAAAASELPGGSLDGMLNGGTAAALSNGREASGSQGTLVALACGGGACLVVCVWAGAYVLRRRRRKLALQASNRARIVAVQGRGRSGSPAGGFPIMYDLNQASSTTTSSSSSHTHDIAMQSISPLQIDQAAWQPPIGRAAAGGASTSTASPSQYETPYTRAASASSSSSANGGGAAESKGGEDPLPLHPPTYSPHHV